ncbi:uncharacterized protein LOC104920354 isoform X2 [Larimichthys crocea]|nr:uncharacterized protein LOC104920354 isoform X2 [Larimichthys crocea]
MALCLYECLRAVGLQRHYARFTSVGVHRVAHLSGLTMEDYHNLGIRSMEDRTRLFHLVQMVKTLDLESLEYEDRDDDDNDYDHDDEGYAIADSSITYDGCGEPDEDEYDDVDEKSDAVSSFSKPSNVCRRLDFSCETSDHHQKPLPVGTVHAYASHNRNNESGQSKGSAISVQLELDTESPVVCSCKGNNNHRSDVRSHQSNHCSKPDIVEGLSVSNFHTRLSPNHSPKPRPAAAASNSFSNKLNGYKDRKGISRKEKLYAGISRNTASEHTAKATPVYESKRTAGYNYGLPLSSPPSPNKKQPDGQRISVCVRKRPLTHAECRRGESDVVTTPSGECVTVHESKEAVDLTQYILQHRFYFDHVFGEESSNEEVYRKTAYPLVQHMLNGGKATCFAYGQTGAGKTHTMLGSSPGVRPGLYALAVRDIFAQLSTTRTHSSLLVYVSFFEIYCGQLYDLLDHRKRLFAREDGQKVVHIAGLRHVRVDSVSSLLEVISQGTEERTQGMSGVNPLSSRSHALLQIQLRGPNQQIAGRMWFVDLAGSERASDTKEPDRQSRMEGAEINQSLLALKECIRSLDQEQSHTPFRQSKLTQVLKDSFIGDSMTCMIANISPCHLATEHTLNTLRYADRVKELRGQGGLKGGRKGKTIPSPKRNLSNGNTSRGGSSVATRGKSPPKKPKLGRQRKAFSPTSPTSRLATEGAVLCSTPKKDRWGEETGAIARNGFGLEQITPIKGFLGTGDKRERSDGRIGRRREKYGGTESEGDRRATRPGEQLHLWEVPRQSGFYHRERENQQSTGGKVDERAIGGLEVERRWIEQRRQVESSTDTCNDVERLRERDLQKVESDNERVRHLRQYHQQLQQFMPSSASSSDHLFSPSACLSFSSSNQASLSPSSSSSLQHTSRISVSALMCHGLEDALDAYGVARVEVRTDGYRGQSSSSSSGEICSQTGTSPRYNRNNDEVDHGDSGGVSEDWREGTEAGFGHNRGKREKRRSLKARGEGEVRVKREDWRSAKVEGGGERRWAWMTTTGTEQADRVTGAGPAEVEASASGNCDSDVGEEGLDASNVPSDGLWSTEEQEGADGYDLVSTHSNNNSNSLFNHPPVDPTHQRAPAERPLSPPCEHTNTLLTHNKLSEHTRRTSNILPLPLRNVQQGMPSSSRKEKEPWFATNATRREYFNSQSATLPPRTPIAQNGRKIPAEPLNLSDNPAHTHNQPQVKAKTYVLAQGETSTDSLSYIMDPLSISLLDVDQQVATASFLQGEQNNTSLCLLEYEREEDKRRDAEKEHLTCAKMANKNVGNKDEEFRLSLLELPQAKTHSPMSETMAATNSEPRKDMCFATCEHCGIGTMAPPISEVMLVSLQDHGNNQKLQTTPDIEVLDNKASASPPKPSTSASVQCSGNTGSPSSHNLPPEYAHDVPNSLAFSISNIALQPTVPTELKSEENNSKMQIRPIIHLSMLEDLYHDQWRVVQAHWEQLEEMESLCRKEGTLLCQQPDMAFGEYVHKLGEIMERKARCVHSMIAQLQPYLKTSHINKPHNQAEDNHDHDT